MFAATISPWYLPTWVSSRTPVTSPIAHSRSPARSRASTGMPLRAGCDPDRFQAGPYPGAPARGHEQSVTAQLATVVEGRT